MKKYLSIIFVLMLFCQTICLGSQIDNIENFLYGFTYSNQDETTRLNRIEKTIYGASTNKTNAQKLAKLKNDMASDLIGQEIKPVEDTFRDEDDEYLAIDEKIAPGSNIDYPVINEMEKTVFNQEFKSNDVKGRLAKLEQKTFGKTFDDDLTTRVDRLKSKIRPQNSIAKSQDSYFDNSPITLSDNSYLPAIGSPYDFDYDSYNSKHTFYNNQPQKYKNTSLNSVEKGIFKQTYQGDNMENRLARIESSMFGTTFDNDDTEIRLNRITSAYNAQKTAKRYDSNKFTQNMATAVQIGTLILMVLACIL